jgi:CBS domain containing-hemolysin-like protein
VNLEVLQMPVLLVAVLLSAFLSGMEAAVMALSRLRIRQWVREGRPGARALQRYLANPENFLWTLLVGNTLANFVSVVFTVFWLDAQVGHLPWLFWPLIALTAFVLYFVDDLLPKALFRLFPNRLALWLVWPFRIVHALLWPLVFLIEGFTARLLRWTGGRSMNGQFFASRDEVRDLVLDPGTQLAPTERALIHRVLDLKYRTVGQIARPLSLADTVNAQTPVAEVVRLCRENGHTRLPVWDSGQSHARIAGVVSLKNILYDVSGVPRLTAGDYLRPALFLEENLPLEEGLRRLQRSGQPLAIIVDGARRERGFLTLVDVLGTVFGEVSL